MLVEVLIGTIHCVYNSYEHNADTIGQGTLVFINQTGNQVIT